MDPLPCQWFQGHAQQLAGMTKKNLAFPTVVIGNFSTLVIPDIGYRESILASFQMDPCHKHAGMSHEGWMPADY